LQNQKNLSAFTAPKASSRATIPFTSMAAIVEIRSPRTRIRSRTGVRPLRAYPNLRIPSFYWQPLSSTHTNISVGNIKTSARNRTLSSALRCSAIWRTFFRVYPSLLIALHMLELDTSNPVTSYKCLSSDKYMYIGMGLCC